MEKSYNDVIEHVDMNALAAGMEGNGIWTGLAVSQRGAGANMSVDVALGDCRVNGTNYSEAGVTNIVISAAHATLNRRDIIVYDVTAGNPAIVAGTAASEPYPPNIPSGDILLATIYVDAAITTIANSDIMDGRVSIKSSIPSGLISMWHGLLTAIPFGWVLCDGANNTPDLRGRFVRGAAAGANPGTTGGADTHTLTIAEMPAHDHDLCINATGIGFAVASSDGANVSATYPTESVGGGTGHNNMPAYYAIAYIMKV